MLLGWLLASKTLAAGVDGFAELRLQGYVGVDAELPIAVVERFRPRFSARLADRLILDTTIEAGLAQGWTLPEAFADLVETNGLSPQLVERFGPADTDNAWLGISSAEDYLAVDRLFLELQLTAADIRLGRQALNWGSGFVLNPSDPFPEVLLTEPWRPRSGMNALRVDLPLGELDALQLVAGSDDAFLHPRLAGRLTINRLETDWSLVGAWREEVDEGIIGLDIKGTLGLGFWLEGVIHLPTEGDPHEELVLGLDYSFPVRDQLLLTVQYYRNGAGSTDPQPSAMFEEQPAFAPAFAGRDYLLGALVLGFSPELGLSTLWIQNLSDSSAFVVPSLDLLFAQDLELSLAGQLPLSFSGETGEFKPTAEDLIVSLPTEGVGRAQTDLGGLVPEATLILWSRVNF